MTGRGASQALNLTCFTTSTAYLTGLPGSPAYASCGSYRPWKRTDAGTHRTFHPGRRSAAARQRLIGDTGNRSEISAFVRFEHERPPPWEVICVLILRGSATQIGPILYAENRRSGAAGARAFRPARHADEALWSGARSYVGPPSVVRGSMHGRGLGALVLSVLAGAACGSSVETPVQQAVEVAAPPRRCARLLPVATGSPDGGFEVVEESAPSNDCNAAI